MLTGKKNNIIIKFHYLYDFPPFSYLVTLPKTRLPLMDSKDTGNPSGPKLWTERQNIIMKKLGD